jgi:hypothetical protein
MCICVCVCVCVDKGNLKADILLCFRYTFRPPAGISSGLKTVGKRTKVDIYDLIEELRTQSTVERINVFYALKLY